MAKARYRVIADILEIELEYDAVLTDRIMPMMAEENDKIQDDNLGIAFGLIPSMKGIRIVLLHLAKPETKT